MDEFLANFNENYTVTVDKQDSEYVGTGMVVTVTYEETLVAELVVVIKGDIDGNGIVTMKDIFEANKARTNTITLSDAKMKAADITGDGIITFKDMLKMNVLRING